MKLVIARRAAWCIETVRLIAWVAAFLLAVPAAIGQAAPPYFTIAAFSDSHIDDVNGNPNPVNQQAWATVKSWIINNRATWNIQGVIGTGDYVADWAKGATSDWAGFANDLNDIVAAGIPVVASP